MSSRRSYRDLTGTRSILLFVCLWLLTSCGGGGGNPPGPTLQSISVSATAATVAAGLTDQCTATGTFSDGSSKGLTAVTWSASDLTLATVDSSGLVTALKEGTVKISAASGGVTGSVSVMVGPPVPTGLVVSPSSAKLKLGTNNSVKLTASLQLSDHTQRDVSSDSTWASNIPTVVNVDSSGGATGLRSGFVTIAATDQGFTGSAAVTVLAVPRYLYLATGSGANLSRGVILPASGELRQEGYSSTSLNAVAFPCETTDPGQNFLYIASAETGGSPGGEVLIYKIDQATGDYTPVSGSPFSTSFPIGCIEFEPSGRFGYTSSINGVSKLISYSRDVNTGLLTELNVIPLSSAASRVALDAEGKYLYAVAIGLGPPGQAYGFSIDAASGALAPVEGTPFELSNAAGTFSFDPSGRFLYQSNLGGQSIDAYSVDRATGKVTKIGSVTTDVNPGTVRFSPDGKFAYTACSGSVQSFSVGEDGSLSKIGTTASSVGPFDLMVDPSGEWLYLSQVTSYLYTFQIDANGVAKFVRKVGTGPVQGAGAVILGGSSAVAYRTKFAYVTSTGDDGLTTYPVQVDGLLGTGQTTTTLISPFSASLLPWGGDLLVGSEAAAPNVTPYAQNAVTGLPSAGALFGLASSMGGIVIDPSGRWAFQTDSSHGTVVTLGKVVNWGNIIANTPMGPVSSYATGAGAQALVVDPSGRFLYVGNLMDKTISAFQYFGTSPQLIEATGIFVDPYSDGSPFALNAKPLALAIDPNEGFLLVLCDDQTLRSFAIDYNSGGHIAPVASVALAGHPVNIATELSGRYVYVADSTGLSAFLLNPQTGGLTAGSLNPAVPLANVSGVWVEPSGHYLYATISNSGGSAILSYRINSGGSLTAIAAPLPPAPDLPSSMVFSADVE